MVVVQACTQTSFISTAGLLLMNGVLAEIWAMINAIQLLAYIYYMDLLMPANSEAFFDYLMQLSEFDFVDLTPVYELLFGWIYAVDQDKTYSAAATRRRRLQKKRASRSKSGDGKGDDKSADQIDSQSFAQRVGPILLTAILTALLIIVMFGLATLANID